MEEDEPRKPFYLEEQNDDEDEKPEAIKAGPEDDLVLGEEEIDSGESVGEHDSAAKAGEHQVAQGEETVDDELATLRREKRLAMNRESARARRKRKKLLLETLEEQVADLAKRNQRYQIENEQLTARVHRLESDLLLARSTITMMTNQSQIQSQVQAQIPSQAQIPPTHSASVSAASARELAAQDNLRRLLQAQSRALSSQGLVDDSLIRQPIQPALDMPSYPMALARGNPGTASMLGGSGVVPLGASGMVPSAAAQQPRATAIPPQATGLHPQSIQNTLAMPPELSGEAGRLTGDTLSMPGVQLSDALSASAAQRTPTDAETINEMLKQRAERHRRGGQA